MLRKISTRFLPQLQCFRKVSTAYNLQEVGKFTQPRSNSRYEAGQLFIHKKLDYRGVVLFPWVARIFDRDNEQFPASFDQKLKRGDRDISSPACQHCVYYQVLVDFRDCPIILFQREGVSFLGHGTDSNKFYTIPGIEYCSHNDILPYIHSTDNPIDHNLFMKFFDKSISTEGSLAYAPTQKLHQFHQDNFDFLKLRDIHCQTTNNVKITAYCFYMGARKEAHGLEHWWRYSITLENVGNVTVQVKERTWSIYSDTDNKESITGRGIIGLEPIIEPGNSFQYSSLVSLRSGSGHMWGTYLMERKDGRFINVTIPPFMLISQRMEYTPTTPRSPRST